jgi:hypothetical protein
MEEMSSISMHLNICYADRILKVVDIYCFCSNLSSSTELSFDEGNGP